MDRPKLYFLKFGGSLITDKTKPYTARVDIIKRLAKEVKSGYDGSYKLIVGHGGGSFPHVSAAKYEVSRGFIRSDSKYGMAIVHYDALKLNMIISEHLLNVGLEIYPIHPSSIIISSDGRVKDLYIETIKLLLKYGIIPLVYGDVGIDDKMGCSILSTEEVFRGIAYKLNKEYKISIIMCEAIDGIYTRDPLKYRDSRHIPVINRDNIDEVRGYLAGSHGIDVTGGMRSKIEILYDLAKKGINSVIINCMEEGNLTRVLRGQMVKSTIITY